MATAMSSPVSSSTRPALGMAQRARQQPPAGVTIPKAGFLGTALPARHAPKLAVSRRTARQVVAAAPVPGTMQVEVDKPLGLQLDTSKAAGGGLVVKGVSGNAAKAGIKSGDTIVYTSSFFGDELWPSDSISFTRSALANAPSPVTIVYVKGENKNVLVKRLPKRPAPARFGRKLTAAQKELATHICVDCGYIYCQRAPFAELGIDWVCPQCSAPKKRFARYDAETGKVKGAKPQQAATLATVIGGLLGIGVLFYVGLTVGNL
ncbi:hypothetical protein WJX72_012300 [[Myrmecia] bisecta]|uniref:Rubredoxin-like domain-containing protein n=1 Tax=[Myrmecia] bisecta TaxID=41462 RepID=A0AAW1PR59_9CHLO